MTIYMMFNTDEFVNMLGNGARPNLYSVKINGIEFYNARYVQSSSNMGKREYNIVFIEYENYSTLQFLRQYMNVEIGSTPILVRLEITFFKTNGEPAFTMTDNVYIIKTDYTVDYGKVNAILEISATLRNNAD